MRIPRAFLSIRKEPARDWVLFLLGTVFFGCFVLFRGGRLLDSVSVAYVCICVAQTIMTIPHELAHAIAARLFGFPNVRIVIGHGPPVWSGRLFGYQWLFNRWPFGGATLHAPAPDATNWQHVVVFAVGPAVNIAAMAVAWLFRDDGRWPSIHNWWGIFFWGNAIAVISNLFPYRLKSETGEVTNDGRAIAEILLPSSFLGSSAAVDQLTLRPSFVKNLNVALWGFFSLFLLVGAAVLFLLARPMNARVFGFSMVLVGASLVTGYLASLHARKFLDIEEQPSPSEMLRNGIQALMELSPAPRASDWPAFSRQIATASSHQQLLILEEWLDRFPGDLLLLFQKANSLFAGGRSLEAADLTATILASQLPHSVAFALMLARIQFLSEVGNFELIERICEAAMSSGLSKLEKIALIDTFVSFHLDKERLDQMPRLEEWARRGLSMDRTNSEMQATLGGVLAECGSFQEAKALLTASVEMNKHYRTQAFALFYLGVIHAAEGDSQNARKSLRRALILSDEEWLFKRVARILANLDAAGQTASSPK
jgi:tetratricopeptide (TPR) repeat protein